MACYLDKEAEKEFINISSTSDSLEQGATGGATGEGNLPAPPHQPAVEVRMVPVEPGEPSEPQDVFIFEFRPSVAVLQVHLDRQIDNAPIVECINQFLGLRIDPTDLRTCAFGTYNHGTIQNKR